MMTKEKTSKRKLLRMVWGIPVLAILLMAFAKPEYKVKADNEIQITSNDIKLSDKNNHIKIKGTVKDDKGNPMPGTSVVIRGTTTGTCVDRDGTFSLEIPKDKDLELIVSYVGYKTIGKKFRSSKKTLNWDFKMKRGVVSIESKTMFLDGDVPPPPPSPIPAPKLDTKSDKPVFYIVEDMPQYKQGRYGLAQYVKKQKSKLKAKFGKKLNGTTTIGFTIDTKGNVTNIQLLENTSETTARAAKIIAKEMAQWKPGAQRGKAVPVDFAMELEF